MPDLVSKLREALTSINPFNGGRDGDECLWCRRDYPRDCNTMEEYFLPEHHQGDCQLIAALLAEKQPVESLLGREGQAASLVEGCAEHNIPLVDGRCSKCRDANGNTFVLDMQSKVLLQPSPSDEWWKVEALDVIRHARVDGDVPTWDRWRSCIINGLLGAFNRGQDSMRASQPSPSTPIVPGTAGLSAEQVREVIGDPNMKYNQRVADRLNAFLGAAKPADSSDFYPTGISLRAQIRNGVLEEAAKHVPKLVCLDGPISQNAGDSYTIATLGCSCGWTADRVTWEAHIRALAERPAPAGEGTEKK